MKDLYIFVLFSNTYTGPLFSTGGGDGMELVGPLHSSLPQSADGNRSNELIGWLSGYQDLLKGSSGLNAGFFCLKRIVLTYSSSILF